MSGSFIADRFGTPRGALRLALSYAEVASGLSAQRKPDPAAVRRLVFVCHGNICRSAYADVLAARGGAKTASFGLSTHTGVPAHAPVIALATRRGLDLTAHRATDIDDFVPLDGDLLLAMETRHLRLLAASPTVVHLPRVLLGTYARFPVPHLHDPYDLDDGYTDTCLARIERAVAGLLKRYPSAAA